MRIFSFLKKQFTYTFLFSELLILREKRCADFFWPLKYPKKLQIFKKYWKKTIQESRKSRFWMTQPVLGWLAVRSMVNSHGYLFCVSHPMVGYMIPGSHLHLQQFKGLASRTGQSWKFTEEFVLHWLDRSFLIKTDQSFLKRLKRKTKRIFLYIEFCFFFLLKIAWK